MTIIKYHSQQISVFYSDKSNELMTVNKNNKSIIIEIIIMIDN